MNSTVHCTHVTVDTFSGITPPDVKSMWGKTEKILERVADQRPEVSSNPTQLKSAFISTASGVSTASGALVVGGVRDIYIIYIVVSRR